MTMRGKGEEGFEGMMWEVSCGAGGDGVVGFGCGEEATALPVSCDEEVDSLAEPEAIAEDGVGWTPQRQPLLKDVSQWRCVDPQRR
jgi:hypothetical protein